MAFGNMVVLEVEETSLGQAEQSWGPGFVQPYKVGGH